MSPQRAAPADEDEGRSDQGGTTGSVTTLPNRTGTALPTPSEVAWYESGLLDGIELGRRQVADMLTREWDALRREVMPAVRARIPFDVAADRRGQHDRAERQRSILTARGVAS